MDMSLDMNMDLDMDMDMANFLLFRFVSGFRNRFETNQKKNWRFETNWRFIHWYVMDMSVDMNMDLDMDMDIANFLLFRFVSNGLWVFRLYQNTETSCFAIKAKQPKQTSCFG
jgi:hypothetical protein